MELRHLRYFVAVAEERHVTRAARRLGMQQPPLSQAMRALEREVGAQLLRRLPRGVELSEAGRALLADARAILAHVDQALATTRRTARGEQGRIAIGFTSSAPFHPLVPRVVRAFREAHPRVSLSMEEGGSPELIDGLRNERLDVVFARTDVVGRRRRGRRDAAARAHARRAAARPPARARRRRERRRSRALADETFIVYRRGSGPGLYDAIIAACQAAGFSPRIGQEAPRVVSTSNFVAAGLGVSIVPASLARMRMDGIVYRRLRGRRAAVAALNLASRQGEASAAVARFVELAKQAAKKLKRGRGVAA